MSGHRSSEMGIFIVDVGIEEMARMRSIPRIIISLTAHQRIGEGVASPSRLSNIGGGGAAARMLASVAA